jgi:hypothetical protein
MPGRISANTSMPAKPPPTTTTVSRRSRSGRRAGWPRGRSCEDAVADGDGLFDRLQADRVVGDAGDREGARDGAGGHDDLVVALLPRLALLGVIAVRVAWSMPVTFAVTTRVFFR